MRQCSGSNIPVLNHKLKNMENGFCTESLERRPVLVSSHYHGSNYFLTASLLYYNACR